MEQAIRQQFLDDYRKIRHAEGRGSAEASYYLALPYQDLSGANAEQWAIRAQSYRYFERKILPAIERKAARPLDILDLGAGNGWMSYRLSLRGHRPVALDIFDDPKDGLRAARHYPCRIPLVEAEFDHLPFRDATVDLAIYNASIHYSTDYRRTLAEARRVLRTDGMLVIIDSPVYSLRDHGEKMVAEKHQMFAQKYGFRSDAVPSIEYFDQQTLEDLARDLNIEWRTEKPWYGWRWLMRPLKARLQRRRPPSRFWILAGKFGAR